MESSQEMKNSSVLSPSSPPCKPLYNGVPMPNWFQHESALKFRNMETKADDIILSSMPKGGTTWMHQIMMNLTHRINDDGELNADYYHFGNFMTQVYPEAVDCERVSDEMKAAASPEDARRRLHFGGFCFDDLTSQPSPRIISTHLTNDNLPKSLTNPHGKGRLIIVVRNLKDVLTSLHFFFGAAKDSWKGNEHGPGSLFRFIDPAGPNAYGSMFSWLRESEHMVNTLSPTQRVLVVYYEALKQDLPAQLDRINAFLGKAPLTAAKREAVAQAVGFNSMLMRGQLHTALLRKGVIGDWKNHMSQADWAIMDTVVAERVSDLRIVQPMLYFHYWEIPGSPPLPRTAFTEHTDPRTWPSFTRITLEEGLVVPDNLIVRNKPCGMYTRPPSEFNSEILPPEFSQDGQASIRACPAASMAAISGECSSSVQYLAESGRYHLFVSGVCPWANGVRAARHLLRLEDVISLDIADGQSSAGWVFLNGASCSPWVGREGPFFLHEVYQLADSVATTRVTVPVLWDTKTHTIVSNDSWTIMKMLATSFRPFSEANGSEFDLYPLDGELRGRIEVAQQDIYEHVLNGVYRAGIALIMGNESGAASAREEVYSALDRLEKHYATHPHLVVDSRGMTAVDLRLLMCLLRYDISYRPAFGLNKEDSKGRSGPILVGGMDEAGTASSSFYPNLREKVLRGLYPYVDCCIDWPSFYQYYRWTVGHPLDSALPSITDIRRDLRL